MHTYTRQLILTTPKLAGIRLTPKGAGGEKMKVEQLDCMFCQARRHDVDYGAHSMKRAKRKTLRMK